MHSERYLSVERSVDEKVAGQPAPPDPDIAAVGSMHRAKRSFFIEGWNVVGNKGRKKSFHPAAAGCAHCFGFSEIIPIFAVPSVKRGNVERFD